jgi:hypothetical protein
VGLAAVGQARCRWPRYWSCWCTQHVVWSGVEVISLRPRRVLVIHKNSNCAPGTDTEHQLWNCKKPRISQFCIFTNQQNARQYNIYRYSISYPYRIRCCITIFIRTGEEGWGGPFILKTQTPHGTRWFKYDREKLDFFTHKSSRSYLNHLVHKIVTIETLVVYNTVVTQEFVLNCDYKILRDYFILYNQVSIVTILCTTWRFSF